MDRSPPPFFRQGPSATVRLVLFAALALGLIIADARSGLLIALRQGVGTLLYPVQRALLVPRDTLASIFDQIGQTDRLRQENTELRRLETANARQLLLFEQVAQENRQLRELVDARERASTRTVVAEVLFEQRDPHAQRWLIGKGMQHGLAAGQPVVDAHGVVGQVTRVFALSAEITRLTDPNLTVPVQIRRTGFRSVASGAETPGRLALRYVSVHADLQEGDEIVTSGLDSLYPAGLPVGQVSRVMREANAQFAQIEITPSARVDAAQWVLVLLAEPLPAPAPADPPPRTRRGNARSDTTGKRP
jgi:rod shape-determining protein MreC